MKRGLAWAVALTGTLAAYSIVLNAVVEVQAFQFAANVLLLTTFALMLLWHLAR